jgi:polyhydroxybutyrate depolymerase
MLHLRSVVSTNAPQHVKKGVSARRVARLRAFVIPTITPILATSGLATWSSGARAAQNSSTSVAPRRSGTAARTSTGSLVTSDGRTRTYVIHVPAGLSSRKRYPLVLLFHGGGGNGTKVLQQTNFVAKADADNFIVVAPNGIANHWADGRGTTAPDREGINDVSFVRQLIGHLTARLPIDMTRVYATGVSNGGMMTERLGCELSDELAAIAADVGPMPTNIASSCKPSPLPFLGIQGGADPLVPLDGGTVKSSAVLGDGGLVQSAQQTVQLWASVDGCDATPTVLHVPPTRNDGTSVVQYTYSGCAGTTSVTYYIVGGMGHGWPPNPAQFPRITGRSSQNINATDVVWSFFAAHHR